jgi:phenylalanyl-tRNA synthetase beta chain
MKFSLEWLSDYVDPAAAGGPAAVRALLDRAGFPIESVEGEGAGTIFDVEITPNRPDVMNHRGLAREIAAMARRSARSAGSTPDGVIPLRRSAPAARGSSPLGDSSRRECRPH